MMALSLVLKLIIAGLHVPMALAAFGASAEANAASPQAQSFLQFVICTPSGVKALTLDANGNPTDVPAPPQASADCGVCSALQTGLAALGPEAVSIAHPHSNATALVGAHHAPCTPSAPRLARGHDPPQV